MVAALVAEALHALLDDTKAIGFVRVRLKRMAHDVRAVQLNPGAPRHRAELGAVGGEFELVGDGLHALAY